MTDDEHKYNNNPRPSEGIEVEYLCEDCGYEDAIAEPAPARYCPECGGKLHPLR